MPSPAAPSNRSNNISPPAAARRPAPCWPALSKPFNRITDKAAKQRWLSDRWKEIQGHERYLGPKSKILTDSCATTLAKLTRNKLATEPVLNQPVLAAIVSELRANVAGQRDPKSCKELSSRINAVAKQLKDPAQSSAWLQAMATVIKGREQFPAKNGKPQKDPCADTITKLISEASAGAKS